MVGTPTSKYLEDEKYAGKKRLAEKEVVVPICFGTVAFWLGKKADEFHSHRWTVYVRSPTGQDLSHVISKVVFKLHDSFVNPLRTFDKPPYELSETGWGEFEISINIYFTEDSGEKPVEIFHPLKLYLESGADKQPKRPPITAGRSPPVITEKYDELVFSEPIEDFYERVTAHVPVAAPNTDVLQYLPVQSDREELQKMAAARRAIAEQIYQVEQQIAEA